MQPTIMVTGSSQIAIDEVFTSVSALLGKVCKIKRNPISKITSPDEADVFICGITQIDFLVQLVPREKILLAEPRFTSEFFLEVAQIPPDSDVCIFHSNRFRINMIIQGLKNMGFNSLNFIPLADTMPQEVLLEKLGQSRFIIGTNAFLNARLSEPVYQNCLRGDVTIIGGRRVSSMESAFKIIQWAASQYQKQLHRQISTLKKQLHQQDNADVSELHRIDNISAVSEQRIDQLRGLVYRAFFNQISPNIQLPGAPDSEPVNEHITHSLESIKQLSDDLTEIADKLPKN